MCTRRPANSVTWIKTVCHSIVNNPCGAEMMEETVIKSLLGLTTRIPSVLAIASNLPYRNFAELRELGDEQRTIEEIAKRAGLISK